MKPRLLLACQLPEYALESHFLGGLEASLAAAREATPADAIGFLHKVLCLHRWASTSSAFMEARDWPNFNILHTPSALSIVDHAIMATCNTDVTSDTQGVGLRVQGLSLGSA